MLYIFYEYSVYNLYMLYIFYDFSVHNLCICCIYSMNTLCIMICVYGVYNLCLCCVYLQMSRAEIQAAAASS